MTQLKSQKKGTFALLLEVPPDIPFHVFAQSGPVALPPGFYLYVESAFDRGGVKECVEHHFRDLSPYIMVVDYFYAEMKMHEAWFTYDAVERTCQWAGLVQERSAARPRRRGSGSGEGAAPAAGATASTSRNAPSSRSSGGPSRGCCRAMRPSTGSSTASSTQRRRRPSNYNKGRRRRPPESWAARAALPSADPHPYQ